MSPLPSTGTPVPSSSATRSAMRDQSAVARIELLGRAGVQRHRRHTGVGRGTRRAQERHVLVVDTPTRIFTVTGTAPAARTAPCTIAAKGCGGRAARRRRRAGSPSAPGSRSSGRRGRRRPRRRACATAVRHDFGIDAVELHASGSARPRRRATIRIVLRLRSTKRARRDHLAYVQRAAVGTTQPTERGVGHARHRREHDRRVEREAARSSGP